MQYRFVLSLACVLSLASVVRAQESTCQETFPARLAEARAKVKQWARERAAFEEFRKSPKGKAVEFFEKHCRFLSKLEIAIRKLDDPMPFVCDPAAGKKPKLLTSRVVMEAANLGPAMDSVNAADSCRTEDPIDLAVTDNADDAENQAKAALILCHDDPRKGCAELREVAKQQLEDLKKLVNR